MSLVAGLALIAAGFFFAYSGRLRAANRITERARGEDQRALELANRAWLKAVARHLTAELWRRHPLRGRGGPLDHPDLLAIEAARTDLVQGLVAEYEQELLERVRERVRPRVATKTWAAFVETAERGRPPAAVAEELGLPVGSVYQVRYSVMKLLRREVAALEGRA
jgi:hypothetical protein